MPVDRKLPALPPPDISITINGQRASDEFYRFLVALMATLKEMRDKIP